MAKSIISRPEGLVSFIVTTRSARGAWLSQDHFAVPLQSYEDGWTTGLLAARELFSCLASPQPPYINMCAVFKAAGLAADDDSKAASKRGAGRAFLYAMDGMLRFAARKGNYGKWIGDQVAEQRELKELAAARAAKQKADFVERMRAARAAKTAQRAQTVERPCPCREEMRTPRIPELVA